MCAVGLVKVEANSFFISRRYEEVGVASDGRLVATSSMVVTDDDMFALIDSGRR